MKKKHILGLDLGTNSIGWALLTAENSEDNNDWQLKSITDAGSRIIPMDAALRGDFEKGNTVSQTADRTSHRISRRIKERRLLRRERLLRVLNLMGFLPQHFAQRVDRYGHLDTESDCKIAWSADPSGNPQFLFQDSFEEMLQLFRQRQPEWLTNHLVPYDWTLYYLRQKALSEPITPYEFAWILLNFNQKRGYKQSRDEEEEKKATEKKEFVRAKVASITTEGEKDKKGNVWYNLNLNNGLVYRRALPTRPNWEGFDISLIVTTKIDNDGNVKLDKNGKECISLSMPKEDDWNLLKLKTENEIRCSGTTVGQFIFQSLLKHPTQKIRGALVRTIDRNFYRDELIRIIKAQQQFIPSLVDRDLFERCIYALYPHNEEHRNLIAQSDFVRLFVDDILFYQRPLKSKKSLISNCPFEHHDGTKDGKPFAWPIKCIPKSNPYYQEFRLWQFIHNLRIYRKACAETGFRDIDVTADYLVNDETKAALFEKLYDLVEVSQTTIFNFFQIKKDKASKEYLFRWNYVEDKTYPCNETRGLMLKYLHKAKMETDFLNREEEQKLWHILYSVTDRSQLHCSLKNYARKLGLDADRSTMFADVMVKIPRYPSDYGAMSQKAICKLLPFMRTGKFWNSDFLKNETLRTRLEHIIDGEVDASISDRTRDNLRHIHDIHDFKGMPPYLAMYAVYDRHSESTGNERWNTPEDINAWLKDFRHHSLRNPIVEQVVTECMRVVRDIWTQYGHIDEIHLEIGRDLRNPADKRKAIHDRMKENEDANCRAKYILQELLNPEYQVEGVRPRSLPQQELFRIYESTVLENAAKEDLEKYKDTIKKATDQDSKSKPTVEEIKRYLHWLEQQYKSPYTGQTIPFSRLFTSDYEIEHVIPQSVYFDDSMQNKVICEAAVNHLKSNMLGLPFIKRYGGEIVKLGGGKNVTVLKEGEYRQNVEKMFAHNKGKLRRLLAEDIDEMSDFINRQLNDTRYISRFVMQLLSRIVREADEQEANSKHLIVCNGSVTDRLKHDWGLNAVWSQMMLSRFERMNRIHNTTAYTVRNNEGHMIPTVPLEQQRGFSLKRIDHRHHALDAIVIAATTRNHVALLSNENAASTKADIRHDLSHKLRNYVLKTYTDQNGNLVTRKVPEAFLLPWPNFTADTKDALQRITVSFKNNLRILTTTSNYSMRYVDGKKKMVPQEKGDRKSIRKPLHKEEFYGEINRRILKKVKLAEALTCLPQIVHPELRFKLMELAAEGFNEKQIKKVFKEEGEKWNDVNLNNIEIMVFSKDIDTHYYASRKPLGPNFTEAYIKGKVDDTAIQKILLNHLHQKNGNPELAFSPEGVEEMNRNIAYLNDGKPHQPIRKVRIYEQSEKKTAVGKKGNKGTKFVKAASGTNLFLLITESETVDKETGEITATRNFRTVPLSESIQCLKNGNRIGEDATFVLSPGDLVYVPTEEELCNNTINLPLDIRRTYKFVSSQDDAVFFVPSSFATSVVDKSEFTTHNKQQRGINDEMIKETCIPIKVDRLGHLIRIGNEDV